MARGGAVPTVEQQMMAGRNYMVGGYVPPPNPMSSGMNTAVPTAYMSPEQPQMRNFNEGGAVAGNNFFTPPSPTGGQTGLFRPQAAASLVPQYSQRQYYNPETGEMRIVNFISGRPAPPGVPPGFVPYDPSKVVEEETKKAETTQQNQEDSSDDRERNEQERKDYAESLTEINELSELSPDFKEFAEKNLPGQVKAAKAMQIDPVTGMPSFPDIGFMESLKDAFGPDFKTTLKEGVAGIFGENETDKAYKDIADVYGLDINNYTTKGFFGNSILDKNSLRQDAKITKAVSDTFGIDRSKVKDIVERTTFERDGDGRIDTDTLVDRSTGELTQTGKDLFGQTLSDEEEADLLGGGNGIDDTSDTAVSESSGTEDDVANQGGLE